MLWPALCAACDCALADSANFNAGSACHVHTHSLPGASCRRCICRLTHTGAQNALFSAQFSAWSSAEQVLHLHHCFCTKWMFPLLHRGNIHSVLTLAEVSAAKAARFHTVGVSTAVCSSQSGQASAMKTKSAAAQESLTAFASCFAHTDSTAVSSCGRHYCTRLQRWYPTPPAAR